MDHNGMGIRYGSDRRECRLTVARAVTALRAAAPSSLNDKINIVIQHSDAAQLPAR